jgi:hypothetical protein
MEELIELVAASFVRHGIECPADNQSVERRASLPVQAERNSAIATSLAEPTALPEHNFRKSLQGDPAP